jgi:arylsulfatase A-like enzyme
MIASDYDLEQVDLVFLKKSQQFLRQHVRENADRPFFLIHSTQAVHLPSFPADRFQGRTKAGPHGDFILELDCIVGELLQTLDQLGVANDTLVMFSSDNGPEVTSVINMRKDFHHDGARPWRGMKRDQWEGGHRVPLIARWPGRIKPGSMTTQTVCLTDVMATCAEIVDFTLPNQAAEDSYSFLPVLTGKQGDVSVRRYTLHQTMSLALSIRRGPWKYLDHRGSGGNNYRSESLKPFALPEKAPDAPAQLYHLDSDPGETTNLYLTHPEIVDELKSQLDDFVSSGRSAPERD